LLITKETLLPKYHKIAEWLREQIVAGTLEPNAQLPSEEMLGQRFQVSRGTVREALRVLVDEGLVWREHGKGTFVKAGRTPTAPLFSLTSFADDMRRQNRTPSTQLLHAEIIPATPTLAERLAVAQAEPIIHIARLRLADGQPVVYETRYLAQALCPDLLGEDLENSSIHWLLLHKYQIPLVRMTHTVELGQLPPDKANHLQAPPHTVAFFVDRLTFTRQNDTPVPAVWYQAVCHEQTYRMRAVVEPSL